MSEPCAGRRIFRMLSLACVGAALERRHHDGDVSRRDECRQVDTVPPCIDAGDAYYLLNPDGDLAPTQAAFERWFASLRGWQARLLQFDRSAVHPPPALHSASMHVAPCTLVSPRSTLWFSSRPLVRATHLHLHISHGHALPCPLT